MLLKHFFILLLLGSFLCNPALAQILNVEKSRLSSDSANYFVGKLGLSFNANNQSINSDGETVAFIGLNTNSDLGYISEHHSFLLLSLFNYTATSQEAINSTGYGHFRVNFVRKEKLSYETFAQLQYDQGRGMQVRWLSGGSLRYNFFDGEEVTMHFGVGGMYEEEVWNLPEELEGQRSIGLWESTNYVSSRITFNEYVNLNIITYYQTGYDFDRDFFRHRINADMNFSVRVGSSIAVTTAIFGAYENRPVVPISKFVYSISNGVIISF